MSAGRPIFEARVRRPVHLDGVEVLSGRFRGTAFARHWHDTLNFGIVEWGTNTYWHRGGDKAAGAGAVNLMNPGEIHDGRGDERGWVQHMFHVDPGEVEALSGELTGGPGRIPYFRRTVIEDADLAGRIHRAHVAADDHGEPLAGQSLFLDALAILIGRHGEGRNPAARVPPAGPRVRRMRDFIHTHVARRITLDDIARAGGLGRFHALRTFRDEVGLPPHAYLKQCRVNRAAALLARGVRPADAAADAGFADQSHLNRAFKAVYGITPGIYRQKQ